jgi:hypothetical protein
MRFIIAFTAVAVVVAGGLISESSAIMPAKKPVSFSERWTPVDEALQSGRFVVKGHLDN